VTPAISTTVTSPTNTTITLGQADTDLATVTGNTAGGNPTGSVAFYQCGPSASATPCTSTANQVGGSVAVSAGSGPPPPHLGVLHADGHRLHLLHGRLLGRRNYFTSSDTTTDECVDVVSSADTVTTSAPTTPTFVVGGSDTDVATVTGNPPAVAPRAP